MLETEKVPLAEAGETQSPSLEQEVIAFDIVMDSQLTDLYEPAKQNNEKTRNIKGHGNERNRNVELQEVPTFANRTSKKAEFIKAKWQEETITAVESKNHESEFYPENEQVRPKK